ncbi:MAG TPA: DUF2516 family protein [Corynebacterium urealyticum]|nr:DUF2516 family protein [Corynebacterium urealyticum]
MMNPAILIGFQVASYLYLSLSVIVLILGVAAAAQVAMTRDDAFEVINRKKQNWLLLGGGAALTGLLGIFGGGFFPLWIIGAVIVGIYWQDVRPAIRDVLDNASGAW